MDALIVFNGAFYACACAVSVWGVLSSHFKDGIIVKAGLICMAFGFGAKVMALGDGLAPDDLVFLSRSNFLINVGVLICAAGYAVRCKTSGSSQRRSSDWMNL